MTPPPADGWRAPLAEPHVFEIARHRFLQDARAVVSLDVHDLLLGGAPGIFDRAAAAPQGVIALEVRHCYPWRVRKGAAPGFGDHICVQFDTPQIRRRWCVAPARLPDGTTWKFTRIGGAAAPGAPAQAARCMSLRHPTGQVGRIVPKSSLVESPALLALAREAFGADPVRPPQVAEPAAPGDRHRTAIVTTMKNEGPFILEWLAYHRVIGVSGFLVYTNDCTDGTDTLLQVLQDKGLVQHRDNPYRASGLKPQHAALQAAESEPVITGADWAICMDVDEFLNIHVGEGRLPDLYRACPNANLISCTWRLFGNADLHRFSDQPVIAQFDRCAEQMTPKPHQAWGFKTLFRNLGIFKKLGVHRPKGLRPQIWDSIVWVNGSGAPMPKKAYRNAWRSTTDTVGYDLVTLNHYAVRSAESFLVKRDRGRVNHVDREQGLAYWFRMNNNAVQDRSIQRMLPALRIELRTLLADPDIRAAHAACVAAHRARIDALRATENYAAFYAELTGERMQRLSRMHRHFGANVFLAGPECIPPAIAQTDPAPDFFFTIERQDTVHD